ncbi:hypothetical protein [Alloalcanivorax gelatiniphagus]|uniref:ESPR domain-containing protein n=1 Tax=Alloalcanivorax gelatiniphagus TaxID=1194167 RepID=A0ABY2XN18_9GAMM|nr:hypothetical protein [Alloalcanivorax gelatiniphagus]TMW13770.1 hypothetical protein FGS76_06490 [Alloalcanivorax gelatiniphagus]
MQGVEGSNPSVPTKSKQKGSALCRAFFVLAQAWGGLPALGLPASGVRQGASSACTGNLSDPSVPTKSKQKGSALCRAFFVLAQAWGGLPALGLPASGVRQGASSACTGNLSDPSVPTKSKQKGSALCRAFFVFGADRG